MFKIGIITCGILLLTACGSDGDKSPSFATSSTASSLMQSSLNPSSSTQSSLNISSSSSSSSVLSSSSAIPSEGSSSSISSETSQMIQFVYPIQYAHLGGAAETKLKLKLLDTAGLGASVSQVFVGNIQLILSAGYWVSQNTLALGASNDQSFEVKLVLDDGSEVKAKDLVINNHGGSTVTKAGMQRIHFARGLALDIDDQKLYVSDPFKAKILSLDLKTGISNTLFQLPPSEDLVADLSWPLGVDVVKDELYLLQDTYSYDKDLGDQRYDIRLHRIDATTGESNEYSDSNIDKPNFRVNSVRNIFVDTEKSFLPTTISTGSFAAIFAIDNRKSNSLVRWFVEGVVEGKTSSLPIDGNQLKADYIVSSFAFNPIDNKLYVARTYSDTAKRGSAGIVAVEAERDPLDGLSISANLWVNTPDIIAPSAMLFAPDGSALYIADSARIWLLNTQTKDITLLSSSNILPNTKGEGVSLGGNITAMALDQSAGVLYAAADTDGVLVIDIKTGNRIAILK